MVRIELGRRFVKMAKIAKICKSYKKLTTFSKKPLPMAKTAMGWFYLFVMAYKVSSNPRGEIT